MHDGILKVMKIKTLIKVFFQRRGAARCGFSVCTNNAIYKNNINENEGSEGYKNMFSDAKIKSD